MILGWLALVAFGSVVWAGEEPLVARVEWHYEGIKLQQAVVFRDSVVELVRNSNFLCGPAADVALGKVQLPYDDGLKQARDSLRQIAARAPAPARPAPPPRSHQARTYLGARDLTGHAEYGPAVTRTLELLCSRFRAVQGVRVRAKTSAQARTVQVGDGAPQDIKKAGCLRTRRGKPETWSCPVPGQGWAWLPY